MCPKTHQNGIFDQSYASLIIFEQAAISRYLIFLWPKNCLRCVIIWKWDLAASIFFSKSRVCLSHFSPKQYLCKKMPNSVLIWRHLSHKSYCVCLTTPLHLRCCCNILLSRWRVLKSRGERQVKILWESHEKFDQISHIFWRYWVKVKTSMMFFSQLVFFSQYLNFTVTYFASLEFGSRCSFWNFASIFSNCPSPEPHESNSHDL